MEWWAKFLAARLEALKAMEADGKSFEEMVQTLNLQDAAHAQRILTWTRIDEEAAAREAKP